MTETRGCETPETELRRSARLNSQTELRRLHLAGPRPLPGLVAEKNTRKVVYGEKREIRPGVRPRGSVQIHVPNFASSINTPLSLCTTRPRSPVPPTRTPEHPERWGWCFVRPKSTEKSPRKEPPSAEFSEGIEKCRGGDSDRLFVSSLATSTTPRARPES